jgi:type IV pilus assembly protein PilB
MPQKKRLGEMLIEAGLIDEMQLRSALAYQQQWGGRIGQILIKLGMVSEPRLMAFFVKEKRVPVVDFRKIVISPSVLSLVPPQVAEKNNAIPLFLTEEGGKEVLVVATSNPTDFEVLDALKFTTGKAIRPVIASDRAIQEAIQFYYYKKGYIPYDPQAKPSEKMTMQDLVRMTREFLTQQEVKPSPPPVADRTIPGQEKTEEDTVILVEERGERKIPLSDEPSIVTALSSSSSPSVSWEEILKALVLLLEEKGILTREELKRKLKK